MQRGIFHVQNLTLNIITFNFLEERITPLDSLEQNIVVEHRDPAKPDQLHQLIASSTVLNQIDSRMHN